MDIQQRVTEVEDGLAVIRDDELPAIRAKLHDTLVETRGWAAEAIKARDLANTVRQMIMLVHDDVKEVKKLQIQQGEEIRKHGVRLDAIDGRLASVDDRLASFDGRLASVDDRLASFDGRFASVDDRLASFDGRFASVDDRLTSLDARVSGHDRRFDALDAGMSEQKEILRTILARLS